MIIISDFIKGYSYPLDIILSNIISQNITSVKCFVKKRQFFLAALNSAKPFAHDLRVICIINSGFGGNYTFFVHSDNAAVHCLHIRR